MPQRTVEQKFSENWRALAPQSSIALALSGGGDSTALYRLLLGVMPAENVHVLHFNHNLRPSAIEDETFSRKLAEAHGSSYYAATWQSAPEGNPQQAGRDARYAFFTKICTEKNIHQLILGHTQDDVLETFLMRLGKGSGLTGLTSIHPQSQRGKLMLLRPMLNISRAELRDYLKTLNQAWQEDPTNEDTRYTRIQMRQLLPALAEQGLSAESIQASITSLDRAEEALSAVADSLFLAHWQPSQFPCAHLFDQPEDIQLRLLGLILKSFHPENMLPRTSKRMAALKKLQNGEKITLGGVILTVKKDAIHAEAESV